MPNLPSYDHLDELVDTDPIRLRDEAFALRQRAEQAEAEAADLRAEVQRMTLAYNGANAMKGVHKRHADRLRTDLDHAKAALAGDNEGIRLFMNDCARTTDRLREQVDLWQRTAEQGEAAMERFRVFLDDDFRQWCSPDGIAASYATRLIEIFDRIVSEDVPADGEQTETPEEGPR